MVNGNGRVFPAWCHCGNGIYTSMRREGRTQPGLVQLRLSKGNVAGSAWSTCRGG